MSDVITEDRVDLMRLLLGMAHDHLGHILKDTTRDSPRYQEVRRMFALHKFSDHCLDALKDPTVTLNPEDRLQIFDMLNAGYCNACGERRQGTCHCQNDE